MTPREDVAPSPARPHAPAARTTAEERTAEILLRIVAREGDARITVGEIAAALGDRAFGVIVLILALPNCIPAPPGFGAITGLLTMLFAAQLALGQTQPRLPAWVERRSFDRAGFRRLVLIAAPHLRRFEQVARPRLTGLLRGRPERALGAFMVLQALIVALPVPLTNWLPGVALAVIAAGILERDGLAVLLGIAVGIAAVAVAVMVTGGFVAAIGLFLAGLS